MDNLTKLVIEDYREMMLNAVIDSKSLKEKLTFKEHLDLCDHLLNMKEEELKENFLSEQIRELDTKWDKFKSYSVDVLIGMIFKQNISTSLIFGFIFRKVMDPCWRKCLSKFGRPTQRSLCKEECIVDALRQVVGELRKGIAKCNSMPDPVACQRKLQKQYLVYAKKLQTHTIKLKKAQLKLQDKALTQQKKAIKARASGIATENKNEMIKIVEESKILREKLSFRDHLKLYNKVRNL